MILTTDSGVAEIGRQTDGNRRAHKRTALLRRLGLLGHDTKGAVIRRATSLSELLAAYKVTHDIFVEQGYIEPDPTGIRVRPYEALPETATFIAVAGESVVGVTTLVVDSPLGVPCDCAFRTEIDQLRAQGRKVCEGTNWLVTKEFQRSSVLGELVRAVTAQALAKGCTDGLGCVSPKHAGFYEAIGYRIIGAERSYSDTHFDPVVLVRLDLTALDDSYGGEEHDFLMSYWIEDNPYTFPAWPSGVPVIEEWAERAEAAFLAPQLLRELFVERGRLLSRCSPEELEKIRRCWGNGLFEAVLAGAPSKSTSNPSGIAVEVHG